MNKHSFFREKIASPMGLTLISVAILLLIAFMQAAWAQTNKPDLALEAFEHLNERRKQVGLAPLKWNAALALSAKAHANYIVVNNSLASEGHNETPSKPAFYGATPKERINKTGFIGNRTAENISMVSYPSGALATDSLIDAPYHREAEFAPYLEAGAAMLPKAANPSAINPMEFIYVINFGKIDARLVEKSGKPEHLFVYPVDGQKNVPAEWVVNESPNPLPQMDGQRVGYPISISANPEDRLIVTSFILRAADADNAPIIGELITTEEGKPMNSYAFWIAVKPLIENTNYSAEVSGTLNGRSFKRKWSFSTAIGIPLVLTPSATNLSDQADSVVTVKISGGTGQNYEINQIGQTYRSKGIGPSELILFTTEHPLPDTVIIRRSDKPCSGLVSACQLTVAGKDSSGKVVSITLSIK